MLRTLFLAPIALLAVLASACFETPRPECAFYCSSEGACPDGYRCAGDGWCKRTDVAETFMCGPAPGDAAPADGNAPDASGDAAPGDAAPADAAPGDAAPGDAAPDDAAPADASAPDAQIPPDAQPLPDAQVVPDAALPDAAPDANGAALR